MTGRRGYRKYRKGHLSPEEAYGQIVASTRADGLPTSPKPLVVGGEVVPGWRLFRFGVITSVEPEITDDMSFEVREGFEVRARTVLEVGCPEDCAGEWVVKSVGGRVVHAGFMHGEGCAAVHPGVLEWLATAPWAGEEPEGP